MTKTGLQRAPNHFRCPGSHGGSEPLREGRKLLCLRDVYTCKKKRVAFQEGEAELPVPPWHWAAPQPWARGGGGGWQQKTLG